jgi:DNA end-binding protein Ku
MARPIWTGSLSFGLVNIPVRLFSATQSGDIHFHQLQGSSGQRVRIQRVVEGTQEIVPYQDIVKGYEISDGRWITIKPEELEAIEPGRSKTIDIEDFVALDDIDPVYFEKTYFLAPDPRHGADRPYALLLRAMQDASRVGIARFVMRQKQYLAAIRPMGDALALETMLFADEVRSAADSVEGLPVEAEVSERELVVALQLIDSLTTEWAPDKYKDTYRERVLQLIDQKAAGETIEIEAPAALAPVTDLMAALKASIERGPAPRRSGARDQAS